MLNTLGEMKTNGWTNLTMLQQQNLETYFKDFRQEKGFIIRATVIPSPPPWAPWGSWGRRACWGPLSTRCRSPGAPRTTPGSGSHQADQRGPCINTFWGEYKNQWPVIRYNGDLQAGNGYGYSHVMILFCAAFLLYSFLLWKQKLQDEK